ncbi:MULTISPECIES: hypothetical protein [Streptococcus]|nr:MULTISPECIES: hypothetical protein [Streptococcus]ETE02813.1 hypothetical protein U750_11195 [Streptococcus pseudopneumoniae G42]QBX18599.1 hypothetical protein Javan433_0065 [Streptococcus phage Javan433]QBX18610.1 hypothetical protein Javan439_0006 [Streptococcus phage Javan439]QBX28098.1 hypothetical protein Javan440_0006 [Streptococcus phage Javan440]EID69730.1 hypothetical protein HMPREF1112_1422 [Streptococcus pseudopneumoniae SK674]
MTILNIIYAGLIVAFLWSSYQDYKVQKEFKKVSMEKQLLEDTIS